MRPSARRQAAGSLAPSKRLACSWAHPELPQSYRVLKTRVAFEVRHVPEHQRFEVALDGDVAVLEYTRAPDTLVLVHTGVPPQFEHRGIAGQLAHAALE